jgi:two-component system, OmpR family, copper resistance phosphate regulon response regulator CusR
VSRILVVEDDERVRTFLERGLGALGYAVRVADTPDEAFAIAASGDVDLMLLDLGLKGRDGFPVLERLRTAGSTLPVIVLTGSRERPAAAVLDGGANDYLRKPFELAELAARVRARLRPSGAIEQTVLEAGEVRLDLRARRATRAEREVDLTARELALLELFMRHPEEVLSREQILSSVWGYDFDPGTNLVSVYVSALRRKLGEGVIETLRGGGYRLRARGPAS